MAPFCSHDCLHIHWRWSPDSNAWVHGWSSVAPFQDSGAPLVPQNQEVFIETPSANVFVYHAIAYPTADPADDGSRTLRENTWQVFMHHGGAYAQGIVDWRSATARRVMAVLSTLRTGVSGA
jgi:hypothetical protein